MFRSHVRNLAERASGDNRGDPLVYNVDPDPIGPELMTKWKQLNIDEETRAFLATCQPDALRDGMATILRNFMSRTDANGMTGRGKMFVLSMEQLLKLVPSLGQDPREGRSLLDIGSGDGSITERFSSMFERVVTTETSTVMAGKLRARGWECYIPPSEEIPHDLFDVITCFNVLDRADKPRSLMKSLVERLVPETGRLVLAVVLPWCPFVENGTKQERPSEELNMAGASCRDKASFETSLRGLVLNEISQMGLEIVSISRVPYISQGDNYKPYYVLWDSIIVCKRPSPPQSSEPTQVQGAQET
mmetsp:Transcript_23870/g.42066  ORF Transcript_23870/g.42066 Transcript_23870/m.42066 type:complete len:304 (+) Transcript_23870:107-1018(+)